MNNLPVKTIHMKPGGWVEIYGEPIHKILSVTPYEYHHLAEKHIEGLHYIKPGQTVRVTAENVVIEVRCVTDDEFGLLPGVSAAHCQLNEQGEVSSVRPILV